METKKKPNYIKITIIGLFILYIILYILKSTGYYEGSIRKKTSLTEVEIKRFEKDIEDGVEVDLKDYLKDQNKNYTNNTSKFGYNVSTKTEYILNEGLKKIVKILSRLFT